MSRKNGISCESDKFPGIGGGRPLVLQFIDPSVYRYYAGFFEQPFGVKIDQVTKTQTKEAKDEKDPRNPKKEG